MLLRYRPKIGSRVGRWGAVVGKREGLGLMCFARDQARAVLRRLAFVVALFATFNAFPSQAELLMAPTGRIILSVTGNISQTNAQGEARFDRAMLESLDNATLITRTPWTEGDVKFEGIWARDLATAVGAEGRTAVALALKLNGRHIRVRDKGPVWINYPTPKSGELTDTESRGKMVWQQKRLETQ